MSSEYTPSTTFPDEPRPQSPTDFEVDSLPESQSDSDDLSSESDLGESDAEQQWKESIEQLELLLSLVIVPYAGKYFGRKFAYWGMYEGDLRFVESETDLNLQAGSDTWNGCIRWTFSLPTKRLSMLLELSELPLCEAGAFVRTAT